VPTTDPEVERLYNSAAYKKARKAVLKRDHGICGYCGGSGNTVDHIIPLKKSGARSPLATSTDNMITACRKCNATKGARTLVRLAFRNPRYFTQVNS
jgi:5-methylcytosine-specific restriction endonuclease McrA